MYPNTFFGLFPPFPRDLKAFVAMSFDRRFDTRWTNVISPALSRVRINGKNLTPHRVDLTQASDSVLTEILDHIARCRVFFADISALDQLNQRAIRNANVFYEIGLAQATRLPEEVILFRSDDFELAFDISNVRVHHYDPDGNPEQAQKIVTDTVVSSLRELHLKRNLAVRRAAESLDYDSWYALAESQRPQGITPPLRRTTAEVLAASARLNAIAHLLDLGAIQTQYMRITTETISTTIIKDLDNLLAEQLVRYVISPFGSALLDYVSEQMGLTDPELKEKIQRITQNGDKHE